MGSVFYNFGEDVNKSKLYSGILIEWDDRDRSNKDVVVSACWKDKEPPEHGHTLPLFTDRQKETILSVLGGMMLGDDITTEGMKRACDDLRLQGVGLWSDAVTAEAPTTDFGIHHFR